MKKKPEKEVNPKVEKIKNIIKRILSVIAAVSFVLGLVIFISVLRANNGEVPNIFGFSVMRVQTGSMEPELRVGSIVITRHVPQEEISVGDIISFYSIDPGLNNQVETHRIVEEHYVGKEREYITKGDANQADDSYPVIYRNVIGKVIGNLGVASGSVIGILQNKNVILFLIIIPLVFITFSEAVNLVNLVIESRKTAKEENSDESENEKKNKSSD